MKTKLAIILISLLFGMTVLGCAPSAESLAEEYVYYLDRVNFSMSRSIKDKAVSYGIKSEFDREVDKILDSY